MNIVRIQKILDQLEAADLLQVDDSPVLHSCKVESDVTGDKDNVILILDWVDEEGLEFSERFTEEALDNANTQYHKLKLRNVSGEQCVISMFSIERLPFLRNW